MIVVEETERKYLLSQVNKESIWEKEHIVYQWYINIGDSQHTKEKIIFDLLKARILYVRICKNTISDVKNRKTVEYLDLSSFDPRKYVGVPFVLKRRSIQGKLFLDKMIRSNENCEYLLEDENDEIIDYKGSEFIIRKEVTNNEAFYNQNMCTSFTEEDAKSLSFLLNVF